MPKKPKRRIQDVVRKHLVAPKYEKKKFWAKEMMILKRLMQKYNNEDFWHKVDFGKEIGIKQSSAQITHFYNEENLKGKQVIGVCNFPKKNIAGIFSEVLILGAIEKDGKVVLLHPSQKVENGLEIA